MRVRPVILGVLVFILMAFRGDDALAQSDQGLLDYGDSVNGDLTTATGDRWTFNGTANDHVEIRLESEVFDPVVDLYGSDNALLASDDDGAGNFNSLISDFVLPTTGTYSIVARGYVGTARGAYTLSLTQVASSGPETGTTSGTGGRFSGGSLRYGQTVDSSLNTAAGDRWTFEGVGGDLISVTLSSADFDPFLELFSANGDLLTSDDDSGNGLNSRISRFALPFTGTYTVVARGFDDTARGDYTLTLNLMDNFVAGQVTYNEVKTGELRDNVGEFWAFDGIAGNFVTVSVSSDEFDTYVELLTPSGSQLASNDDISDDNRNSRLDRVQLPTDGTYIIVVRGYLDTARGSYTVTITSPNAPVSSDTQPIIVGSILYADTVSGNLSTSAGDAWTFDGSAGDVISISLNSQVFDTQVFLLDATGVELASDNDSGALLNALIDQFTLPSTGTFTIVARGVQSSDRGTYTLSLQVAGGTETINVSDAGPLTIGTISRGATVNGTLTTDQGDAWTFDGKGGEVISIAADSDQFDTYVELFDANGTVIAFNDDSGPRVNALIEAVELPADGEHTIVVRSQQSNARGVYALTLQSNSPSTDVVSASDDAIQATLVTASSALPNAVILSSIEVTNLQPGSVAYCVTVSLESDLFNILSPKTVILGNISGDETDLAQFEIALGDAPTGTLDAVIEWYDTQDCNTTPHILTTNRQFAVEPLTWTLGIDVYPTCTVASEVLIMLLAEDGQSVSAPKAISMAPYSVQFNVAAQSGTYYVQAQLYCTLPSGTQVPHAYSRSIEVDHDRQRFSVGSINVPPDGDLQ